MGKTIDRRKLAKFYCGNCPISNSEGTFSGRMRKCNSAEMKNGKFRSSAMCLSSRCLIAKNRSIHEDAFPLQESGR